MDKKQENQRRAFLKKSALAGASLAFAGAGNPAAGHAAFTRTSPSSPGLLKVGILTTRGGHITSIWGPLINPTDGKTRVTGMVMTHAWDIDTGSLDAFCEKYDVEKVSRYDGMIGKVDAIVMADFESLHWNQDLVRPYLESGVPIFINRPFASSLKNARDMIETARRHGTPIMCGSSLEYVQAVDSVRTAIPGLGELTGFVADNAMSDYATHGVHGIYFVHACV
ncbi:MAG: Gfo/Idh/MocA family oxidoreductase, partial [Candidatus Latescibacteria bacterium]|nr:Gfo/Idh/MocA family oxidoreductase [Candidatus Latescibacterota bacterium]